jgi:hypothetical protein
MSSSEIKKTELEGVFKIKDRRKRKREGGRKEGGREK